MPPKLTPERFWSRVDKTGDCWLWLGPLDHGGYGKCHRTDDGVERTYGAHRISYELSVGPIPDGLQLDHLCRVRSCVNPDHLEPVTQRENLVRAEGFIARQVRSSLCPKGHPYDYIRPAGGGRDCSLCKAELKRQRRAAGLKD